MSATVEELAHRQTVFREVNENIADVTRRFGETDYQLFICECSNTTCADALELTADEYAEVRAHGARFIVTPGHELDEVERVVDGNRRFSVVEKIGEAAHVALTENPRHP